MEGEEGKKMGSMAIGLFLLLLIISIIVGIVLLASNYVNKGTNSLANTMDSTELMKFAKYDNAEVTGSDILSAVKTLQNENVKFYVANKGANGGTAYNASELSAGTGTVGTVQTYGYMGLGETDTAPTFDTDSGKWLAEIIPDSVDGEIYNTNFTPLTEKNNRASYVRQSGRYWAYMVYDENTGEMAALLFVQIK